MRFTKQTITSLEDVQDNFEQLQVILNRLGRYAITNDTTDRSFDANATTVDELADVFATVIHDLFEP